MEEGGGGCSRGWEGHDCYIMWLVRVFFTGLQNHPRELSPWRLRSSEIDCRCLVSFIRFFWFPYVVNNNSLNRRKWSFGYDGQVTKWKMVHLLRVPVFSQQLDGAHVEFLRGVANPLGIKVIFSNINNCIYIDDIISKLENTIPSISIQTNIILDPRSWNWWFKKHINFVTRVSDKIDPVLLGAVFNC